MTKTDHNLDKLSPAPLYHQIASEIRRRIEAGELKSGEALAPLREAAEEWGVHFHTVRHAYAALARDGLVVTHRGPRGTEVSAPEPSGPHHRNEGIDQFVLRVIDEARRRWKIDREDLIAAISKAPPAGHRPVVYVVECSEHQCVGHAEEISSSWDVEACPWPLSRPDLPTDGCVVATYFHYNDIRRRWPHRLDQVRFVTISPDPNRLNLPKAAEIAVCEQDQETAESVAADVCRVLGEPGSALTTLVVDPPERAFDSEAGVLLFAPRVWARLSDEARSDPRAWEIRYRFDAEELHSVAAVLGWHSRQEVTR